jgi:hypothetical protein
MKSNSILHSLLACLAVVMAAPQWCRADDATKSATQSYEYECQRQRTGYFDCVAPYARCGYGKCYAGYYVGGGSVCGGNLFCKGGEPRYCHEGTFGMDYSPFYSKVALLWSHGKRYQGGEGQYEQNRVNNGFPNFFRR